MRIIGGLYKGRILKAPKGDQTRPTSSQLREALFNICQGEFEGANLLDLCCGSGAIGIEALSRGAKEAYFVDSHPLAITALKENLKLLQLTGKILPIDSLKAVIKLQNELIGFDFIYLDPPYEADPRRKGTKTSQAAKLLNFIDHSSLLKPGGRLFIEEGGLFDHAPLIHLKEVKTRTFGKSFLFEYTHK